MALEKVRNVHPPVAKMITETQGYQMDLFTVASTKNVNGVVYAVAGMAPEDTVRAVVQDSSGTPTKLVTSAFAMHDGRASANFLFDTVIATDELIIGANTYVGTDTPSTDVQWLTGTTDALSVASIVEVINAKDPTVICEADGDAFIVRSVATGKAGDLIIASSADTTITEISNTVGFLGDGNGDAAVGTLTCASVIATDTVTVNGNLYTARLNSLHDVNDPNFFHTGLGDVPDNDECAASLSVAINIKEQLNDTVIATVATNVVTVTAANIGAAGNAIALEETGGTVTLSAAVLEDGTDLGGGVYTVAGSTVVSTTGANTILWIDKR